MARKYLENFFTDDVLVAQEHYFHKRAVVPKGAETDLLGHDEWDFIQARDSFYLATVSDNQWPYIQHRGGIPGFLKVTGPNQLGFLDYTGNRQMLSTGNLSGNNKVALFLMDYPHRERLKLMGTAEVLDVREHPEWLEKLGPTEEGIKVERIFLITVISFDWNCSKYITPRFTAEEVSEVIQPLKQQIAELEAKIREMSL